MANSSLTLSSIDFDTLKENFKTFLSSQSVFKDYNFDGSNINVLLDVMSYNTYLNSFYLNMAASEMFLDSAQKYDSVVSHAKELNYLPQSSKSSVAELNLTFETNGLTGQLIIPKGTRFSGINSNGTYTFVTNETSVYVSANDTYQVANLVIYEGDYFQDSYVVDLNIENQQFLITNKNVDISSVQVTVIENNGANTYSFSKVNTLFGLNDESEIYFLQAAQNNLYEIVFGDGLFGRKPLNSAVININYRVCNGTESNGVTDFNLDDDLGIPNIADVSMTSIITVNNSNSGANAESIDSIKFAAPRYFATQQRAVTNDDYSSLILAEFGGEVSDIIIYGGETVEPKQYGRVIVCIKPSSGTIAPNYIKNKISNYLLDFIALPNRVIITDPDYFYCSVESFVQYDRTITTKTESEIKTAVLNSIINYSKNNLEYFGNDLRYSRLISTIDNSDSSIVSNDTSLRLVKRLAPKLSFATSYNIDFNNTLYYEGETVDSGIPHTELYTVSFDTHNEHSAIISDQFQCSVSGSLRTCYLSDDGLGNIKLYTFVSGNIVPEMTMGAVDYETGIVSINNLEVVSYDRHINLYARLRSKDIIVNQNKILLTEPADVSVIITEVQK